MIALFDRTVFFDSVRPDPFPDRLTQQQVDGMNAILDEWESRVTGGQEDVRHLAYMLATTFHETAQTMWPIEEYGKGKGHSYGEPDPETGHAYYGRGFVQLTHKENYERATTKLGLSGDSDLVWHPEKALDLPIAAAVLYRGTIEGWFTSRYLGQYFSASEDDPKNARQVINGNDKDELIAGYHYDFLDALQLAQEEAEPVEPIPPEPEPKVISMTVPPGVMLIVNGEEIILEPA